MNDKKYLPFKFVHLCFIFLGICFYVYSISKLSTVYDNITDIVVSLLQSVSAMLALFSGFIYFIKGYKKNAAAYFKGYVWVAVIADMFATVAGITEVPSYLIKIVWAASLIFLVILATGKDLGRENSFTLAILIFLCKFVILVSATLNSTILGLAFIPVVLDIVAQLILTITTTLMVCGKYLDKASRGTN